MNFAMKDRFCINLLITAKSDRIPFRIIKGYNFDYFEMTRKLR